MVEHTLGDDGFIRLQNGGAVAALVVQSGHGGDDFVGRAGGVGCAEGTVKEGLVGVGFNVCPVLIQSGKVVGGIAGTGQDLTGFHVHDHNGTAGGIVALLGFHVSFVDFRVAHFQDQLFQGILSGDLQVQIQGGFHVVACLGGGLTDDLAGFLIPDVGVVLLQNGAVTGDHVHTGSVNAVEVVFKGFLKAGLTDVCVHGVALVLVLGPVVGVHTAHITQHMGGVFGVIFPDGGGFHHQARGVQLQNGAEVFVGNVLDEGVGGQIGNAAKVKFVADAHNGPGHFVIPFLRDLVPGAQLFQQQWGGDVRV